ncbi:MAG: hypothetical protein ACRCYE_04720 [Sarcina sp.]
MKKNIIYLLLLILIVLALITWFESNTILNLIMIIIGLGIFMRVKNENRNNILNIVLGKCIGLNYLLLIELICIIFNISLSGALAIILLLPGLLIVIGSYFIDRLTFKK